MRQIKIGSWNSASGKTFVIAEAGVNHNGDLELAKELVIAAKKAGADAVKFQSFKAEWMCLRSVVEKKAVAKITGGSQSAYDMYKSLELSDKDHGELFKFAKTHRMTCFSSAFDPRTVPFLKKLGSPAIKIASSDMDYKSLLMAATSSGLPLLVSTGLSDYAEVLKVYEFILNKKVPFALLYCIAAYPAKPQENDLNVIRQWSTSLDCITGFSDHSEGIHLPVAAVALGARIIEKHFTLDRKMPGPDQALSIPPDEFREMIGNIRDTEKAIQGNGYKVCTPSEHMSLASSRRGIKVSRDLKKGTLIQAEDLAIIKPQTGISPWDIDKVVGKTLKRSLKRGENVDWKHLE